MTHCWLRNGKPICSFGDASFVQQNIKYDKQIKITAVLSQNTDPLVGAAVLILRSQATEFLM